MFDYFFKGFAFFTSISIFMIAFFRAANTGITWDEALTYLNYVLPNIFDSLFKNQLLNNHILNSFFIRIINIFSQSGYNELFIRFPNLVFYCIYMFFSFLIAKQYKNKFFVFILFIFNYYINEFFGLARGYGMACASITGAFYFFEKWKIVRTNEKPTNFLFICFLFFCLLSVLSNSITLYIVISFLLIINFKYKKDLLQPSYFPFYIIFFLNALHTIINSVGVGSVYSTHSIYSSIMSIPNMFSNIIYISWLILIIFLLSFFRVIIKTKTKNDYCLLMIFFIIICLFSHIIFRRGYPVTREMIPFYPLFVMIMASATEETPNCKTKNIFLMICTVALCFQFVIKINLKSTGDWSDNYSIREVVYNYIGTHGIQTNKEEFRSFIDIYWKQSGNNPVVIFYAEKAELFYKNNTGE